MVPKHLVQTLNALMGIDQFHYLLLSPDQNSVIPSCLDEVAFEKRDPNLQQFLKVTDLHGLWYSLSKKNTKIILNAKDVEVADIDLGMKKIDIQ